MSRFWLVALGLVSVLAWPVSGSASPASDEARRLLGQRQDAQAFQTVDTAARRNDEDAIALLGWFYDSGRHVARDYARAAQLYSRVYRDNPSVQWRLGVMNDLGQGVPENPGEAVRLFRMASGAGDANANASLAVMYANGRGVGVDYAQSQRYYRRAAELGSAAGFLGMGLLYQYGLGVDASQGEAAAWFLAAHAMRDTRARELIVGMNMDPQRTQTAVTRANQLLQSFRRRERVADPSAPANP